MQLVVDANIIIAALIRAGHTRHVLLLSTYSLVSPAFLLEEIEDHAEEIVEKRGVPFKFEQSKNRFIYIINKP